MAERAKITLTEDWFDLLIEILAEAKETILINLDGSDIKSETGLKLDLAANEKLTEKLVKYCRYEEIEGGHNVARIDLFASEAKDLIWQMLLCCANHVDMPDECGHYMDYKAMHEEFMQEPKKKAIITKSAARELLGEWSIGYDQLVQNKDGSCYLVDHGRSGDLIKVNSRWEDPNYGFDENVFRRVSPSFKKIVSWDDEQPLDVMDFLIEHGFVAVSGNDIQFLS